VSGELELAERALAHCEGDAQVTVTRERSLHARFARSEPTQATDVDDVTVHVLVLRDGQGGTATTNAAGDDALRAAARRAADAAAAAAAQGPGEHPGLPGPQAYGAHDGFDAATAQLDPRVPGAQLSAAFAAAADAELQAFGIWSGGEVRTAIASSAGVRASDAVTDVFGKVVCRDADGRSGYASAAAVRAADVDLRALARQAASRVGRGELAELEPGTHPVVLGADAVGELIAFLGGLAFNGLAHAERRGALDGRLGTRVAAPSIGLGDAPTHAATLPRAFDADGIPKAPLSLIEGGVAQRVVHDVRSAARAGDGAVSTGHSLAPGGSPWGPAPTNLVLAAGRAEDEHELAGPIERGLYVHRLWYVNTVDPKETLLTGVTRDGTFLIEDGAITRPLRDARFTDTVLGLLERTEDLGAHPRLVADAEFYGRRFATGVVCPPLRASGLRITGGA
jgi:predicted Zn-dependent protease